MLVGLTVWPPRAAWPAALMSIGGRLDVDKRWRSTPGSPACCWRNGPKGCHRVGTGHLVGRRWGGSASVGRSSAGVWRPLLCSFASPSLATRKRTEGDELFRRKWLGPCRFGKFVSATPRTPPRAGKRKPTRACRCLAMVVVPNRELRGKGSLWNRLSVRYGLAASFRSVSASARSRRISKRVGQSQRGGEGLTATVATAVSGPAVAPPSSSPA
jgi:hypothetical protein